jgi:ribosomal protein S18 acetylase RimI-like enzyme
MNAPAEPVLLEPSQKGQAAETLAQAFRNDPMYAYVFPEIADRLRYTRRMAEALITCSLRYGQVYTTPALTGVACWLQPGQTEMNLWRSLRTGFALERAVIAFPKEARERMLGIVGHMDKLRKQAMQRPYWYLWIIGVRPDSQGQGIGSSLLRPVLRQADASSLPCYLETETESNVAFYDKRGFTVAAAQQVAGQGLRLWTMIREPQ